MDYLIKSIEPECLTILNEIKLITLFVRESLRKMFVKQFFEIRKVSLNRLYH